MLPRRRLRIRNIGMPPVVQARAWVFTIFEPGLAPDLANKQVDNGRPRLRYLIFQIERCPDTDRLHIQGYVQFKDPVRRGALQRWLGAPNCHVEKANGSADQNRAYCTKEETRVDGPWEIGQAVGQGQRTDLEALHDDLRNNSETRDLWENHFPAMVRYHRSVSAYRFAVGSGTERDKPEVRVYWGPTGTGKTRRVHWETGGNHWTADPPNQRGGQSWFDGYEGQENVLIDDYGGEYGIHFFKRLLDRYPMNVQVKGGYANWRPKTIYITSNHSPDVWYAGEKAEDVAAVMRRIDVNEHQATDWIPPQDAQDPFDYPSPDLV